VRALWAILRLRCPYCRTGPVFAGWFTMRDRCTTCGLVFAREPGYYLGSFYFSYFALIFLAAPTWIVLRLAGVAEGWIMACTAAQVLGLVIPVTRWSRVLWMFWDHTFDPRSPGDDRRT